MKITVEQAREKIFTAIGESSMCWSETPKGIFKTTMAERIGYQLMEDLGFLPKDGEK